MASGTRPPHVGPGLWVLICTEVIRSSPSGLLCLARGGLAAEIARTRDSTAFAMLAEWCTQARFGWGERAAGTDPYRARIAVILAAGAQALPRGPASSNTRLAGSFIGLASRVRGEQLMNSLGTDTGAAIATHHSEPRISSRDGVRARDNDLLRGRRPQRLEPGVRPSRSGQ